LASTKVKDIMAIDKSLNQLEGKKISECTDEEKTTLESMYASLSTLYKESNHKKEKHIIKCLAKRSHRMLKALIHYQQSKKYPLTFTLPYKPEEFSAEQMSRLFLWPKNVEKGINPYEAFEEKLAKEPAPLDPAYQQLAKYTLEQNFGNFIQELKKHHIAFFMVGEEKINLDNLKYDQVTASAWNQTKQKIGEESGEVIQQVIDYFSAGKPNLDDNLDKAIIPYFELFSLAHDYNEMGQGRQHGKTLYENDQMMPTKHQDRNMKTLQSYIEKTGINELKAKQHEVNKAKKIVNFLDVNTETLKEIWKVDSQKIHELKTTQEDALLEQKTLANLQKQETEKQESLSKELLALNQQYADLCENSNRPGDQEQLQTLLAEFERDLLFDNNRLQTITKCPGLRDLLYALDPDNQKYIKKCLYLAPKLHALQDNPASDQIPSEIAKLNSEEREAIKKIAETVYARLENLHKKYEQLYGTVAIDNGEPKPDAKQLEGVFEMTNKRIAPLLPDE
jgi:hypothetical protein